MSHEIIWQQQSVQDFFRGFAWSGPDVSSVESANYGDRPFAWQCSTVQAFFGNYNWQGLKRAPAIAQSSQAISTFSVTLPVKQFFAYFTWPGQPKIAPVPQRSPISQPRSSEDRDLTLSNLSDLF